MHSSFRYTGVFFDPQDFFALVSPIRSVPLPRNILHPHITFSYQPDFVDQSLFGTPVHVHAYAYGNNGQNEGLRVQMAASSPELTSMFDKIPVPHITIAITSQAKAINTRYLDFHPITPLELVGIYGGYTSDGPILLPSHVNRS